MPDRDVFTKLPKSLRPAARSLLRAARGETLEALPGAEALNRLLDGGVPALPRLLEYLADREAHKFQPSFPDDSFAALERRVLSEACSSKSHDWKDEPLRQAAIHAHVRGIHDPHYILRDFVMRLLRAKIIDAQGGVADYFAQRREPFDERRLEAELSPLLDAAAWRMHRNPHFKRLGLATRDSTPVDPHAENLL